MKLPLISAIAIASPSFQPIPVNAQAQAIPAAVAACYAAPWACAVVGAGAAGWIIVNQGQQQVCTWSGCKPLRMMQDADAENTSDEGWGTRAPNQQTAESKCQREAANRSQGAVVKCLGCKKVTQGTRTVDPRFV